MLFASLVVSAFLAAGADCSGVDNATVTSQNAAVKVSVCVKTDAPLCGVTYRFAPVSGSFRVNSRTPAPAFTDLIQDIAWPQTIQLAPIDGSTDYGAMQRFLGGTHQIATYDISVLGARSGRDYSFRLESGFVAVDLNGYCTLVPMHGEKTQAGYLSPEERPIAATFTIKRR